jgi:hypothetical protein
MMRDRKGVMRQRTRAACTALSVACALLLPAAVSAQHYSTSAGWGGGYVMYAPFIDAGEDSPTDIGFNDTWVALLHAESWQFGRWIGLRLGGYYSHGTVTLPTRNIDAAAYGIETAALIRVVPPAENRFVSLYLIGGGGLNWYGLGEGGDAVVEGANVMYHRGDRRQWSVLGGGGLEVLTGFRALDGEIGVRAEAVDQIMMGRPFRPIGGADPGMMHNLRFSLTLFAGVPSLF